MGSKYATPSMALWPMSGFELKAYEIQQMQKKSLPRASLISKTRNYRETRTAINSLSWGSFMAKTGNGCQHRPAQATCTRLSHGVCYLWRPLLFPSVTSLQRCFSLPCCHVSPGSDCPSELLTTEFLLCEHFFHVLTHFSFLLEICLFSV